MSYEWILFDIRPVLVLVWEMRAQCWDYVPLTGSGRSWGLGEEKGLCMQ